MQSLSTFWGANGSPTKIAGLPSVRIVYSDADRVSKVIEERKDRGSAGEQLGGRDVGDMLRCGWSESSARGAQIERREG